MEQFIRVISREVIMHADPAKHILIVHAHPEAQSLNGSLTRVAVAALREQGHEVQVSDLYGMKWNAVADAADFRQMQQPSRLRYPGESKHAFATGTQSPDIEAEQHKLLWADAVIFQFPLWWFSLPAILKGWVERVFAYGLAYGVGEHGGARWGDRYGEGRFAGRRAMLSITIGGRAPHYGDRGVNGPLLDLLFPIHHGVFWYPGMNVLPPFVVYQADRLSPEDFEVVAAEYRGRLQRLFSDAPIPFRSQNGGHYDNAQVLRPEFGSGASGFALHLIQPNEAADERPRLVRR
jgi:NAD(P)H dehydrogenase (quinone)